MKDWTERWVRKFFMHVRAFRRFIASFISLLLFSRVFLRDVGIRNDFWEKLWHDEK